MRPLVRLLERLRSALRRGTAGSTPPPARESTPDPLDLEFDLAANPSDEAPAPKDERVTLSPVKRAPISSHPPGRRKP